VTKVTLSMVTLVVPDYDAGIDFFTRVLGFDLIEDSDAGGGKRWVVVGGPDGGRLLLARAANDAQHAAIGNQTGGRVGFFVHTYDFGATHSALVDAGIAFEAPTRVEGYGTVAVFTDPFGNRWDLIESRAAA
jgi:catechol 2,3-dioxygenase-like lactoylglutathione lyase family enzyme